MEGRAENVHCRRSLGSGGGGPLQQETGCGGPRLDLSLSGLNPSVRENTDPNKEREREGAREEEREGERDRERAGGRGRERREAGEERAPEKEREGRQRERGGR